jgi:hypothetical protein
MFRRVGKQMYAPGQLLHVEQHGMPREYEPTFEADVYWLSED